MIGKHSQFETQDLNLNSEVYITIHNANFASALLLVGKKHLKIHIIIRYATMYSSFKPKI